MVDLLDCQLKGGEFYMNYGDRSTRFVAGLLDAVILVAIQFVLGFVLGLIGLTDLIKSASTVIGLLISVGYYVVYQAQTGQTIGKKVMKLKVVTASGKTPTMVTFFLREIIGKFVSALIFMIGYLMILWDPKRQGLHDKIASTYVVKA